MSAGAGAPGGGERGWGHGKVVSRTRGGFGAGVPLLSPLGSHPRQAEGPGELLSHFPLHTGGDSPRKRRRYPPAAASSGVPAPRRWASAPYERSLGRSYVCGGLWDVTFSRRAEE